MILRKSTTGVSRRTGFVIMQSPEEYEKVDSSNDARVLPTGHVRESTLIVVAIFKNLCINLIVF